MITPEMDTMPDDESGQRQMRYAIRDFLAEYMNQLSAYAIGYALELQKAADGLGLNDALAILKHEIKEHSTSPYAQVEMDCDELYAVFTLKIPHGNVSHNKRHMIRLSVLR